MKNKSVYIINRIFWKRYVVLAAVCLLEIGIFQAASMTYYVNSSTGNDSYLGTSSNSAWQTLKYSIPRLTAGDTLIMTGTFKEPLPSGGGQGITFNVSGTATNPITLTGQNAIINVQSGSGDYGNYYFTGDYLVLDGLYITSTESVLYLAGAFTFGGSHITLKNSIFYNMAADFITGGADKLYLIVNWGNYNTFSNLTFSHITDGDLFRVWGHDNLITHNTIINCTNPHYDYGGKTQLHADLIQFWGADACNSPSYNNVFENSRFEGSTISGGMLNSANSSNIGCTNMNDWVYRNNIFIGNGSTGQAIEIAADHMHVYNNVFYNKPLAIDIFAWAFGNQIFYNNVFIGSGLRASYGAPGAAIMNDNAWDAASQNLFSSMSWAMYNLFLANNTLLVTDPGFVDAAAGDFHLKSTSPLRGAGVNLASDPYMSTTDLDGNARPATGNGAWDIGAYEYTGDTTSTSVQVHNNGIPTQTTLYQNYPNPFNPATTISYRLSTSGFVKLSVYDVLGREVAILVNEEKAPGIYTTTWNATGFAGGTYIAQLRAGIEVKTIKLFLTK